MFSSKTGGGVCPPFFWGDKDFQICRGGGGTDCLLSSGVIKRAKRGGNHETQDCKAREEKVFFIHPCIIG
jgi:hypothetical protein